MKQYVSFVILVVLYKLSPKDSTTLISLSEASTSLSKARLIIRDNSPEPLSTEKKAELNELFPNLSYEYIHNNGENLGLSTIYNQTIKTLKKDDYLVLFDHDSVFSSLFFEEAQKAILQNPQIPLFLPLIYCNNQLVSPSNLCYFKGSYWKTEQTGVISSKKQTAINSGMIIASSYLQKQFKGYDERLLFYGTDNDFMLKYQQNQPFFYVFSYPLKHSLDFYKPNENFRKKGKRFLQAYQAHVYNMQAHGKIIVFLTHIYYSIYSIKFAIEQKELRFCLYPLLHKFYK